MCIIPHSGKVLPLLFLLLIRLFVGLKVGNKSGIQVYHILLSQTRDLRSKQFTWTWSRCASVCDGVDGMDQDSSLCTPLFLFGNMDYAFPFLLFFFLFFRQPLWAKFSFSFFLHSPCASDIEGDKIWGVWSRDFFFLDGKHTNSQSRNFSM